MPPPAALELGSMLRSVRMNALPKNHKPTQEWLASEINRKPQQLSMYEHGASVPDLGTLAEIYAAVKRAYRHDDSALAPFATWVRLWIATQGSEQPAVRKLLDEAREAVVRPDPGARRRRPRRAGPATPFTSLAELPRDDDVTVILSDRRETSKDMSAAECLIYSGSMTDSMLLSDLPNVLPYFRIKSDKVLVKMRKKLGEMPEIANSHLLVIGSPAANWGARLLNKHAVFPFRIDPRAVRTSTAMLETWALQSHARAEHFARLVQLTPEERTEEVECLRVSSDKDEREIADFIDEHLSHCTARDIMNKFKADGFLDPADQQNYGTQNHQANDFAVVTLARNPWSSSGHRAIICAGKYGPGTVAAVRELLTNPSTFEKRPMGAVFEIGLDRDIDWASRLEQLSIKAETGCYTIDKIRGNLERAVREPLAKLPPVYKDYWNSPTRNETWAAVRSLLGLGEDEA